MYITDNAIIMARKKVKSSDVILTLLTENHGKVRVYANRAREAKSKLAAESQLFTEISLCYKPHNDFASLTESAIIDSHKLLASDIERFYLATYIMELIDKSLAEGDYIDGLYQRLSYALKALERTDDLFLLKIVADLKLISILGFEPCLNHCSVCGAENALLPLLSVEHGGVLCKDCQAYDMRAIKFSLENLKKINYLLKKPFSTIQAYSFDDRMMLDLDDWLNQFIEIHLTMRPLKSLKLLKTILH